MGMTEEQKQEQIQKGKAMMIDSTKRSLDVINSYVQMGPQGLSVLCFFVGLGTVVLGSLQAVTEVMTGAVFIGPFHFVLSLYTVFFGFTAVLLESDADRINTLPVIGPFGIHLHQWQKFVHEFAFFLTRLRGRGVFYIFIGTLCISECLFCPFFILGLANGGLGVFCMLLSFGIKPDVSYSNVQKGVANLQARV